MASAYATLRGARWAELLFAAIALFLALGLPISPANGREVYRLIHWYGMVTVALGLFVGLRRPSAATWWVAVGLSIYFLGNVVVGLSTLATSDPLARGAVTPAVTASWIIVGLAALAQLAVAERCWRARAIRNVGRRGQHAPVA